MFVDAIRKMKLNTRLKILKVRRPSCKAPPLTSIERIKVTLRMILASYVFDRFLSSRYARPRWKRRRWSLMISPKKSKIY